MTSIIGDGVEAMTIWSGKTMIQDELISDSENRKILFYTET